MSRVSHRVVTSLLGVGFVLLALLLSRAPGRVQAKLLSQPATVIRYVSQNGSDTANSCTSSTTPCRTIQHTVGVAQDGDEVRVAAGTYTGTMSEPSALLGVTATVVLSRNIGALLGGYSLDFAARNPDTSPSILNASGYTGTFVIFISGTNTLIDGFTLTGASGAFPGDGHGPFIYQGGAIRVQGGALTLSHNRIQHNFGIGRGGGLYVTANAALTMTSNLVVSNTTDGDGGGIYIASGVAMITNNTVVSNVAAVNGGGLYAGNAAVAIVSNTIAYNQVVTSTGSDGAGVRIVGSQTVTLSHNNVYSNVLPGTGGSGFSINAPAIIDGNAVHHNRVATGGGAVRVGSNWVVTLTNNVVTANEGEGIGAWDFGDVRILNNTVVQTNSNLDIHLVGSPAPTHPYTATVLNNIAASNQGCGIASVFVDTVVEDYNDLWGRGPGCSALTGHDIAADPQFANAAMDDYHIRFGSPAMNAGTNAGAPAYDREGVLRPQGGRVDMGAYEVVVHSTFLPVIRKTD